MVNAKAKPNDIGGPEGCGKRQLLLQKSFNNSENNCGELMTWLNNKTQKSVHLAGITSFSQNMMCSRQKKEKEKVRHIMGKLL